MPYIKEEDRKQIDELTDLATTPFMIGWQLTSAGEINYIITQILRGYLDKKGVRYSNINEVIGAVECAKLEIYRRLAAPYEDRKIKENGDVYN